MRFSNNKEYLEEELFCPPHHLPHKLLGPPIERDVTFIPQICTCPIIYSTAHL